MLTAILAVAPIVSTTQRRDDDDEEIRLLVDATAIAAVVNLRACVVSVPATRGS